MLSDERRTNPLLRSGFDAVTRQLQEEGKRVAIVGVYQSGVGRIGFATYAGKWQLEASVSAEVASGRLTNPEVRIELSR